MGVMDKLIPANAPKILKASTYKNLVSSKKDVESTPSSGAATAPGFVPTAAEFGKFESETREQALAKGFSEYDVPTIFTTFMIFYLGFFGFTLLFMPGVFASDGLPFGLTNPAAYWTTITDEMDFIFRIAGAGFLCLVLGPFMDDILGMSGTPLGVSMSAFTHQMLIANFLTFAIFLYYTLWAPLGTAVPLTWMIQTFVAAFVFGWSLVEVSSGKLISYYAIFCTLYYGGFSLMLLTVPDILFGPPSPIKYWESWPTMAVMTARFLGSVMLSVVIGGYYLYVYSSTSSAFGFVKACTTWNVLVGFTFILPAFFGEGSAVANMWQIQLVAQVPIIVVGLYIELSGMSGPWMFSPMCPPKCGLNAETFNLVTFIWLVQFVPVMFTDPNMIMGPEPITGLPMFMEPWEETAKFFGKSWAIAVLVLILGPYLYGFNHVAVAKQSTFGFFAFCSIFGAYFFFFPTLMNPMTMIPLAASNFLLFCFGLYVVLTAAPGTPMV
jgi:hypothetical protein